MGASVAHRSPSGAKYRRSASIELPGRCCDPNQCRANPILEIGYERYWLVPSISPARTRSGKRQPASEILFRRFDDARSHALPSLSTGEPGIAPHKRPGMAYSNIIRVFLNPPVFSFYWDGSVVAISLISPKSVVWPGLTKAGYSTPESRCSMAMDC